MRKLAFLNSSAGRKILFWALAAQMTALNAGPAQAAGPLPVPVDSTGITTDGNTMKVGSGRVGGNIDWSSFDIDDGYTVRFLDSSGDTTVNRIGGGSPSSILGSLLANGNIYLLNPDGIVFGSTAKVNVGGLVASSMDYDPETRTFSNPGGGDITVQEGASINAGAFAYLVGKSVNVAGTINSGDTFIGAYGDLTESEIELATANGGKIVLRLDDNAATDGGSIELTGNLTTGGAEAHSEDGVEIAAADAQRIVLYAAKDIRQAEGSWTASAPEVHLAAAGGNLVLEGTVSVTDGSLNASTQAGGIHVGDNGADANAVFAKQDIVLATKLGQIEISGKTSTQDGDITVQAGANSYSTPGQSNFNINRNGKLESGRDLTLEGRNGDIHISNKTVAGRNVTATIDEQGSIYFDNELNANGSVSLTTQNGDINVGEDVASSNGDISMAVIAGGNVRVSEKVTASAGGVTVTTNAGDIDIGDKGEGVKTVSANKDITLETNLGKIHIKGATESSNGNVTLSAKSENYTSGTEGMTILLDGHGKVKAADSVNLQSENGDIHVTGLILSDKGLTAEIQKQGSVYFDRSVAVSDDIVVTAQKGDIHVDNDVLSSNGDIAMTTTEGDIQVVDKVISNQGSVTVATEKGDIEVGDNGTGEKTVSADKDITLETKLGKIKIEGETLSKQGDITLSAKSDGYTSGSRNVVIGDKGKVQAAGFVNLQAENGDLEVSNKILSGDGLTADVQKEGDVYIGRDVDVRDQISVHAEKGDIQANGNLVAGNAVELTADAGSVTVLGKVTAATENVTVTAGDTITLENNVQAGQDITIQSAGDILLPNVKAGEDLAVTATGGNISQANGKTLTIGGLSELTATSGNIALGNEGNDFQGTVSASGRNVTLTDKDGIELGNVSAGQLTVDAKAGNITQESGTAVTVTGETSLTAATGDIALGNEGNDFQGTVSASGRNVTLTDKDGIVLGNVTASAGDVAAKGSGVTVAGNVEATGGVSFTGPAIVEAAGQVKADVISGESIDSSGTIEAGSIALDGTLTSTGTVTADGVTAGTLDVDGGTVDAKTIAATVDQDGGTITATTSIAGDADVAGDASRLTTPLLTGNLTQHAGTVAADEVTSKATVEGGTLTASKLGGLEQSGGTVAAKDDSLEVTGTTTQGGGTLGDGDDAIALDGALTQTAGTINAATLTLGGGAEQTDGATVKAASLVLGSEGEVVSLVSAKNDFGSVQGAAENLTIRAEGSIQMGRLTAQEADIAAGGSIVDDNSYVKTDNLTMEAGGDVGSPDKPIVLESRTIESVTGENIYLKEMSSGNTVYLGLIDADGRVELAAPLIGLPDGKEGGFLPLRAGEVNIRAPGGLSLEVNGYFGQPGKTMVVVAPGWTVEDETPHGNGTADGGALPVSRDASDGAIPGSIVYDDRPVQGDPDLLRKIHSALAFLEDTPERKTTKSAFGNPPFPGAEAVGTDMVPTVITNFYDNAGGSDR